MVKIEPIDAALEYISALGANYREAIKQRDAALGHILILEDLLIENGITFKSFDEVCEEKDNK